MIFKMDGTLNTYDVVVDFQAADFASNFLHQVFDLCQGGQVSSHAQVRLLLQHDSKDLSPKDSHYHWQIQGLSDSRILQKSSSVSLGFQSGKETGEKYDA